LKFEPDRTSPKPSAQRREALANYGQENLGGQAPAWQVARHDPEPERHRANQDSVVGVGDEDSARALGDDEREG